MTEIRCVKCNRLLLRASHAKGEVKCPKCGYYNHVDFGEVPEEPYVEDEELTLAN